VVQAITPDDRVARKEFAVTMLEKLDEDNDFLRKIMFSDEATFHVSGKVNKQNIPSYLDTLENVVYPQLQELQPAVFFQQGGATPHWSLTVRASFNQHFPNR
jgi:hypothetical protein